MAVPYTGIGTGIGLGAESTWGTAVARSNWLPAADSGVSLRKQRESLPVGELVHGDNGDIARVFVSRERTEGGFGVLMRYDGLGLLYEAMLGGTGSTAGTSSPYTHTYGLGSALSGLTVEVLRGTAGNAEVFEGFTVGQWTISGAAGEIPVLSVEGIGETSAARGGAGTPTYSTGERVVTHQNSTLTFGGTNYVVQSFEITGNNNISDLLEVGSLSTSEPPVSNFREFRATLVLAMRSDALHTALHADTTGDLVLTFTGGTSPNALTITLKDCTITDVDDTISGPGVIQQTVSLLAKATAGSNDGIIIAATNASSSATAN